MWLASKLPMPGSVPQEAWGSSVDGGNGSRERTGAAQTGTDMVAADYGSEFAGIPMMKYASAIERQLAGTASTFANLRVEESASVQDARLRRAAIDLVMRTIAESVQIRAEVAGVIVSIALEHDDSVLKLANLALARLGFWDVISDENDVPAVRV
jgi:hypothetical protein